MLGIPSTSPDFFKRAARIHTGTAVARYLMANAYGRWDGVLKAHCHRELCSFYVAIHLGVAPEQVQLDEPPYEAVHTATQVLTDALDEEIGFPLDQTPDYDKLEPLFFERFHTLALQALADFEPAQDS